MHRAPFLPLTLVFCFLGGVIWQGPLFAKQTIHTELVLAAAISLKEALTEASIGFEKAHPGEKIVFNFASSGQIARQIEQGANFDVFISASDEQMTALAKENLIEPKSTRALCSNSLVVVVPSDSRNIKSLKELTLLKRIAMGDPETVPAGGYAREALQRAGIYTQLQARDQLVFGESVRQVLAYVESGNVDAGIVYATDARIAHRAKTALSLPKATARPIRYSAAVISQSAHKQQAQSLVNYLVAPESQHILKAQGFVVPNE